MVSFHSQAADQKGELFPKVTKLANESAPAKS